jgi:CRISPR-associated protein Cas6/Cse3/CasE subtype I-E
MYHSHLMINVGNDPDHADWSLSRRWLRNLYRVHQRLCMAFPSSCASVHGRAGVAPCRTLDGDHHLNSEKVTAQMQGEDVHQQRGHNKGFLFRIDYPVSRHQGGRKPVIVVQSNGSHAPRWDDAFGLSENVTDQKGRLLGNAAFLLAAPPQCQEIALELDGDDLIMAYPKRHYRFRTGDVIRFRIRANPTKKVKGGGSNGKRVRVNPTFEDHLKWLSCKLEKAAEPNICIETFVPGWSYGWRTKHETDTGAHMRMVWWSVLFEGAFRLRDPRALKRLIESGIGSGKAFGFGLLSVRPFE